MSGGKDSRVRVWTFIAYPESAPKDYMKILKDFHVPMLISPLHDKDPDDEDPTKLKKAHWHIIILFDGPHSYEQAKEISDSICARRPERVPQVRGMVRYLIHLDDPEKFQYPYEEIRSIAGADPSPYFAFSQKQIDDAMNEIEAYIISQNILRLSDLIEYARQKEKVWIYVLRHRSTNYFAKYIQDRRYKQMDIRDLKTVQVDQDGVING